jgi:hypothetical protein
MCAATAWWSWQGEQNFLWNLMSFRAFHKYHKVMRILVNRSLEVEAVMRACRINCTPSLSWGRLSVCRGGLVEN